MTDSAREERIWLEGGSEADWLEGRRPEVDEPEFVKLQVWTRTHGDGECETIYKLPDGSEYTGDVYGRIGDQW